MSHAEIEELLGAYALDAVEEDERRAVDEHLRSCPRCRAELVAHREVAGLLGNTGGKAPEGVWERIADELSFGARGDASMADLDALRRAREADVVALRRSPRRRVRAGVIGLGALAAALALVVGLLSARVSDLNSQLQSLGGLSLGNQVALALSNPRTETAVLTGRSGVSGEIVALPSGNAYFVAGTRTPRLPLDQTYQLWALAGTPGRVVSLGLLGRTGQIEPIRVSSNMKSFMVTAEPLGGTTRPTGAVLAQGSFRSA